MIKCAECGHDVSDKALTCPNCGNPLKVSCEIPVEFTRISKLSAGACKFVLSIDGVVIGELNNGKSFTSNIIQGRHQLDIEVVNPFGKRGAHVTGPFIVPDDANKVNVEMFMGLSGPTIKNISSS